ncbi:MAG: hypothetical protein ACK5SB_03700, partial [Flavobacterium sp.]
MANCLEMKIMLHLNFEKSAWIALVAASLLTGCGSSNAPFINTDPAKIDKTVLKTTPIKESDLKRWSHLDLIKDTVPGRSVDRAYAELLK